MHEPVKEYELTFEERAGYLYAHVASEVSGAQVLLRWFSEIIPKCRETGANKVLVHVETGEKLSTSDAFDAATGVIALDVTGIKIAYVDPNPANFDTNQFGELVAVNRGVQGKVFLTVAEGEAWLFQ